MLSNNYDVTNIAQAGVSEYKIYQQLINHDTTKYDKIIISHTSEYRIPVVKHPIHSKDILHSNCDLIYTDIKEHEDNPKIKCIVDFYENYFHVDNAIFTHTLIYRLDQLLYEQGHKMFQETYIEIHEYH